MKVEIVSIGTELLVSDILDTNAAYASRSLREVHVELTCKVTVGDDPEMIADALRGALRRADVVIASGGLGEGPDDFTRQAVAAVSGRALSSERPGVEGATILGEPEKRWSGLMLEEENGTLICLPGRRREMAYLLETEVIPYLRQQISTEKATGWALLRSVGVMESSLKQDLLDLTSNPDYRVTFDSFAGQTNIRLWVQADTKTELDTKLDELKLIIMKRLGDHIYGTENDRLENVVLNSLIKSDVKLAVAECYTSGILTESLAPLPGCDHVVTLLPEQTWHELAEQLNLESLNMENLTHWCRKAAERVLKKANTDLGLVVYNNVTQGGVQILVTLASPHGVSVTQRSFGGHPDNIDQWALTLGLSHLRRWLLVHY
jgi:nicotinamide-nucleotide amidase